MQIHQSAEDYLETILMLNQRMGRVRSIDVVNELGYTKASVSIAMKKLRENGYIQVDEEGYIVLLPEGEDIAQRIYERHRLLTEFFVQLGVTPELAAEDASKENINLEAALYVDKSGEVVGRTYSAKTEEGNTIEIRSFLPKKGNKFGYELSFVVDKTEYAKLSGKGEMKSDKVNAKLYASVDASLLEDVSKEYITDGEKFLSIEVKDMDVQALEKGSCKGEIIIKADENKMPAFALYSLDWTFEGDTKKARSEIKVLSGSSAMVTLNIASEDGEDPKVSAPAADAKIYDFADENAINEYAENIDLITFLTTLKQNCGLDLTSLLLGTMQ